VTPEALTTNEGDASDITEDGIAVGAADSDTDVSEVDEIKEVEDIPQINAAKIPEADAVKGAEENAPIDGIDCAEDVLDTVAERRALIGEAKPVSASNRGKRAARRTVTWLRNQISESELR
jgi:hypothetical protein